MSVARLDLSEPPVELDLSPERLRAMDGDELADLAAEIRRFLVASLAATGGHLGSNLGVVELTLALHRVFESPKDAIIWDTGHQAYVHKLVTGRRAGFGALRQRGGLSGYPNRAESEHDFVENSHASTGLSYAFGLAEARRLEGDRRPVVAVVGDGALTGGLAYEALNNIGAARSNVVVVLNDNGRSYSPTVSALSTADEVEATGDETRATGDAVQATARGLQATARGLQATARGLQATGGPGPRAFFETLGLGYVGPVDGHDLGALEAALRDGAGDGGDSPPVVVHVHTVKGRGYGPAERDQDKRLHDVGPFEPATGAPLAPRRRTYTEAFSSALLAEATDRPEVVAVTAAMAGPTGLHEFRDRFPDRFFDVGIAEQHAVTAAAGMAMGGLRPVVAIYSTFLNRAWDQLYYDVGLHRLPVVFCIDRAGVTGDDGPSHHGLLDLALLTKVPGMTVFTPSSYGEVAEMLHEALELTGGPVAIRWPKSEARLVADVGRGRSARKLRIGREICLLGVGKLLEACEEAAELLARDGLDATVWDVRVAAPLDPAMIDDVLCHEVALVAEDGISEGGAGALVASAIAAARREGAPVPTVLACGVPLEYVPHGTASEILSSLGLDGRGLRLSAQAALAGRRRP